MPIEILAGAIVSSFLAPMAKQALDTLADQVGSALGSEVAQEFGQKARSVWEKVRARFGDGADKVVFEQFEASPDDKQLQDLLGRILQQKLQADPELATELDDVVQTLSRAADGAGATATAFGSGDAIVTDLRNADFSRSRQPMIGGKQQINQGTRPAGD